MSPKPSGHLLNKNKTKPKPKKRGWGCNSWEWENTSEETRAVPEVTSLILLDSVHPISPAPGPSEVSKPSAGIHSTQIVHSCLCRGPRGPQSWKAQRTGLSECPRSLLAGLSALAPPHLHSKEKWLVWEQHRAVAGGWPQGPLNKRVQVHNYWITGRSHHMASKIPPLPPLTLRRTPAKRHIPIQQRLLQNCFQRP